MFRVRIGITVNASVLLCLAWNLHLKRKWFVSSTLFLHKQISVWDLRSYDSFYDVVVYLDQAEVEKEF